MSTKFNANDQTIVVVDGDEEILCQILFTFESPEFKKNYVVFYPIDQPENEEGEITLSAASYIPTENGFGELNPVETDEEWELIEEVLDQYEESLDDEECGNEDCCCDDDCDCDCDCECDCEEEEE